MWNTSGSSQRHASCAGESSSPAPPLPGVAREFGRARRSGTAAESTSLGQSPRSWLNFFVDLARASFVTLDFFIDGAKLSEL